ncbi:zinc finger-containing ubiquitin peptidase 1 isoform X2 [Nerophis lumbriciformis]|uniref:zinc finger-containing ubiquitin peptidase 1 isoform X2 n=1 Tax=Nerophis lumbriciformis TaxID=546530 RepID=UPI002ADF2345|nr:zinc finger-containing ubiquitin peptidase 1-like isoform X1 [Nerophis lumbriciformis]
MVIWLKDNESIVRWFQVLLQHFRNAVVMLTCEICSEEIMLEEDMKTHILLSHLENDVHCPLCSLSGVSCDELAFHISIAHPESCSQPQSSPHTSSGVPCTTITSFTDGKEPQAASGCSTERDAAPFGSHSVSFPPQECNHAISMPSEVVLTSEVNPATSSTPESPHPEQDVTGVPKQIAAKQKPLSSPKNERFSCPMCALVFSSSLILQEHVELHLQDHHPARQGDEALECPLCPVVCIDSASLQQHVELHLDSGAGSSESDETLAWRLQQEMEKKRKVEESRLEREEFKKLQRQFGLDGSGGYRSQMERTMARDVARGVLAPAEYHCKRVELLESLASGVDDGRTRTQGVMAALYEYYQIECRECVHVWLSADTDHYCSSTGDKGWGCGYRNFQMLLSSLLRIEMYAPSFPDKVVPSIPHVQGLIEEAWRAGLDPQGASHFNHRLQGTRAWIGATEIYVLLTSLGFSGRIIDFHQPTGSGGTHPQLFEWVREYFNQSRWISKLTPRLIQTSLPPLYLQHQGHSRSIVGLEQRKNGSLCLLILDPGISSSDTRKLMSSDTMAVAMRQVRKLPGSLKHLQYQVVAVEGMLSNDEREIHILNSRILCAEKIP